MLLTILKNLIRLFLLTDFTFSRFEIYFLGPVWQLELVISSALSLIYLMRVEEILSEEV